MSIKIFFALFFYVSLAGCQPKSDVDKCVDVHLESLEEKYKIWVKNGTVTHRDDDYKIRMREARAQFHKECLRAQAGKE